MTREELVNTISEMRTEDNSFKIEVLLEKIASKSDEEIQAVLADKKVKSASDVKKIVGTMIKNEERDARQNKFVELNDMVSYGSTGKTVHVHLVPKDVKYMLVGPKRREYMKYAQASLIDAIEKIKVKMQTDKKFAKVENVYAVSGIMSGIVARWFKELEFDVKTLPIEQAKTDPELGYFYTRFKDKDKLGRANLTREVLMSQEWEDSKEALKERLGLSTKEVGFAEQLQALTNTDVQVLENTETIESRAKEVKEVKPEVIE